MKPTILILFLFFKTSFALAGLPSPNRKTLDVMPRVELLALEDLFLSCSKSEETCYKIVPRFWTNKNGKEIRKDIKKSLNLALRDTFIDISSMAEMNQQLVLKIFKQQLFAELKDNFVKHLRFFKILSGEFQIDFIFEPYYKNNESFSSEFSSNNLVNLDDKSLSRIMKSKEKNFFSKMNNLNLAGETDERFSYTGGMISMKLNLLKVGVFRLLRNEIEKARGFVRFRRYYKSSLKVVDTIKVGKNGEISAENVKYLTVDIYRTFNDQQILPKLSHVEFQLGQWDDSTPEATLEIELEGEDEFGTEENNEFTSYAGKIKDGGVYLSGITSGKGPLRVQAKVEIEKLIFDIKKERFKYFGINHYRTMKLGIHRKTRKKNKMIEDQINSDPVKFFFKTKLGLNRFF